MSARFLSAMIVSALAALLARGVAAKATIAEETVHRAPCVVMENAFVRLVFNPGEGGHCTDFLYKPAGKRFVLPRVGSLLGNRVWNYADGELYFQWQRMAWEHEVERRAGEVALVMRCRGKVNFTRATRFEKRIVLRDGEAMARVTHTFFVGQELMTPRTIGLWFYNKAGVIGERTVYTFPLDDGIVTLDPGAGVGQEWFYNPSRGWAAVTGESGAGLCFTMEFRRLMCFYLCPGTQPTFEWAFRTLDIKNGQHFATEERLIPFAGIRAVHGGGGGVVAGFDAPDTCTAAQAQAGLAVRALLCSGMTQTGEVTISLRRLPDGAATTVLRRSVSLKPGQVLEAAATVKPPQEGTWLLLGTLTRGGQEVMDFVKPLVVGAPSAAVRIQPKEQRIGRATERFEDRTPLAGTAPKDIEISMEVESPHVKWAKPYSGGKLKILVLTSCLSGREAVELAQRLDMEIVWVSAGSGSEVGSMSRILGGRGTSYRLSHMNDGIKQALLRPLDAIIIGGMRGEVFTDEVLGLFQKKVSEGTGLVYVQPRYGPDRLYSFLPVEKEMPGSIRNGQWKAEGPHFITTGVPLAELPRTDGSLYRAKGRVLATAAKYPLIVTQEGPGKGRVVVVSYNTCWQHSANWTTGITPFLEQPTCTFDYWEYYFSLLAKSLIWAAHKEAPVRLEAITTQISARRPEVLLTLDNQGAALAAKAETTLSDAYGKVEHKAATDMRLNRGRQTVRIGLREDIPGGLHLADVIVKDKDGKVLTWASTALRVSEPVGIAKISFGKRAYYPGDTAKATVEVTGPGGAPHPVTVRATFTDALGRLLVRAERRAAVSKTGTVSFDLPVGRPLVTTATLRVTALVDGRAVAVGESEVFTFPEKFARRAWGDWESGVWGTPAGAYEREYLVPVWSKVMKEYGITTVLAGARWQNVREYEWAVRAGFQIMPMGVAYRAINVGHRVPKGKMTFKEQKKHYLKTHDKKYLVRPVCLNSETDLGPSVEKLHTLAEYCGWLEPIGYNLGDEMSTTYYVTPYDYDFGPEALASFRKWAKERYATLGALNRQWDTDFKSWDAVMPMTAHEVKGRGNYAPWADHRMFMDDSFAGFFKWTRDRLRERDPKAGVGMSGSQAAEAYGGYNWYTLSHALDFIQNYTHRNTPIMQRSFGPNLPRAPWYGYAVRNPAMRHYLWWRLFHGNYGGSFFAKRDMFRPDLLPSPCTADAAPVVKEFQAGVARLLRNCERVCEIGMHYSHSSIRGAFISGADALFRDNRMGWVQAIEDLGYQCEFLARPQLESGELAKRDYRAFILPYSVSVSEKEAEALRRYVQQGGLLIADAKAGLMDEHCTTLAKGRLEDLFGITRPKPDPLAPSREGEVRFVRDRGLCKLKGLAFDCNAVEPALEAVDGQALGALGKAPVVVVKDSGKGTAVFLNFFMDSLPQRRKLNIEAPVRRMVESLLQLKGIGPAVRVAAEGDPAPHTFTVRYTSGDAMYAGTLMDHEGKQADWSAKVRLTFPRTGFVYDLRKGRALGRTNSASTTLLAGDVALYAVMPYRVTGVAVAARPAEVRPGDVVKYDATVQAEDGRPGMHVILVDVIGPDGKVREHYGAKLVTRDGKASGEFHPALNDPTGPWTIRAIDFVTRVAGTKGVSGEW